MKKMTSGVSRNGIAKIGFSTTGRPKVVSSFMLNIEGIIDALDSERLPFRSLKIRITITMQIVAPQPTNVTKWLKKCFVKIYVSTLLSNKSWLVLWVEEKCVCATLFRTFLWYCVSGKDWSRIDKLPIRMSGNNKINACSTDFIVGRLARFPNCFLLYSA